MAGTAVICFRPAGVEDIPLIQKLSSRIWQQHYPGIITSGQIDYMLGMMYSAEVLADDMRNKGYRYIIVLRNAEAVGYMGYRFEDGGASVLLSKLYLLPSLHGTGTGRAMLQYVKDDAVQAGAKLLRLFVNRNNVKAIRAYERFGMARAAEIMTDIGGGFVMDDFRMELRL